MRVPTTKFQNAFGKYLKLATEGSDIIVTKNGEGVAKLITYNNPTINIIKEGSPNYCQRNRVSYDQFIEITDKSDTRFELIDGTIYQLASPSHNHQKVIGELFAVMHPFFLNRDCLPVLSPYDVKLFNDAEAFDDDPNIVQPDILVICDEEKVNKEGRYQGIPSLVVEVISPSTRSKDMLTKLNLYAKSGIKEYWIVDLKKSRIYLYQFEEREIEKVVGLDLGEVIHSVYFRGLKVDTTRLVQTL